MTDNEADDKAAEIIEAEIIGVPPTPEALGELLGMILGKKHEHDDVETSVDVVVIGGPAEGFFGPTLPKYQTPEEHEKEEHDATHQALHSIVDIRSLVQKINDSGEDTALFDQLNAELHHLVEHLSPNRTRNALLIATSMINVQQLKEAIFEYCGPVVEGMEEGVDE